MKRDDSQSRCTTCGTSKVNNPIEFPACASDAAVENPVAVDADAATIAHSSDKRIILDLREEAVSDTASGQHRGIKLPGTTFERYRLCSEIGRGGFGVVYLAEQTQPVRRQVAIKLLRHGGDSADIVERFSRERQILAMMSHSGIAQIFDAGFSDDGRPYFAMEYVEGQSLTRYCDQQKLSVNERISLVVQVCEAVQHAHQKGTIHRDLKPTNILVSTNESGNAVPKVIDFGISKALIPDFDEGFPDFPTVAVLGTPIYMSPEQALGDPGVDTRSDIYSLGVILHELLTGVLPFDPRDFEGKPLDEVLRTIRETEPKKPSTQVRNLDRERLNRVAKDRTINPARFAALLKGDLDWIILKALTKDRNFRYQNVAELADDLKCHLVGRAVSAAPPSASYHIRRFVRRNRVAVAAVAAVVLALSVGLSATTWQLYRGNTYRDMANESVNHLQTRGSDDWLVSAAAEVLPLVDPDLATIAARYSFDKEKWALKSEDIRTRFGAFRTIAGAIADYIGPEKEKLAAAVFWLRSIAETSDTKLVENPWKQFELGLACAHLAFVLESESDASIRQRGASRNRSSLSSGQTYLKKYNSIPTLGDDPVVWRARAQFILLGLVSAHEQSVTLEGIGNELELAIDSPESLSSQTKENVNFKTANRFIASPLLEESTEDKSSTILEEKPTNGDLPQISLLDDLLVWNAGKIRGAIQLAAGQYEYSLDDQFCSRANSDDLDIFADLAPSDWLPSLISDDKIADENPIDKRGFIRALKGFDKALTGSNDGKLESASKAYLMGIHDALSVVSAAQEKAAKTGASQTLSNSERIDAHPWWKHAEVSTGLTIDLDDRDLQEFRLNLLLKVVDADKLRNSSTSNRNSLISGYDKPVSELTTAALLQLFEGWTQERVAMAKPRPHVP